MSTSTLDNLSEEFSAAARAFLTKTMGQSIYGSIRHLSQGFLKKHEHQGYCKINNGQVGKIKLDSEDVESIRARTFECLPDDIDIYSNRDKGLKEEAEAILDRLGKEGSTQLFNEVLSHESSFYFDLPAP